jgi:hypothetical protein
VENRRDAEDTEVAKRGREAIMGREGGGGGEKANADEFPIVFIFSVFSAFSASLRFNRFLSMKEGRRGR